MSYLFAANLFVWGGIFFYVATLKKEKEKKGSLSVTISIPN